ncbi:hypothetical protein [Streptomyces sp. NPDC058240]|uniref:hypothetical protein n=1 Tax=Streptomyces sp. NPDC058240 TaxID=3346396 RepID=UPI0036E094E9
MGHLGFRECSVADAEKLAVHLAEHVAHKERRPEQVRVELLTRCRAESIEPPTPGRCDRIVAAALRAAEESLTAVAAIAHSRVSSKKAWFSGMRWVSQPMAAGPESLPR